MYSLYLYFRGLSLRNTSKSLEPFKGQNRSYVAVWEWIQQFGSSNVYNKHRRVSAFIIDETIIQIGKQHFWLWICIGPIYRSVLGIYISEEKHVGSREFYHVPCIKVWKTCSIHIWRYLVSSSMQLFTYQTSITFSFREKSD